MNFTIRLFLLVSLLSSGVELFSRGQNDTLYFQQKVDYTIVVKLNDKDKFIDAAERIIYRNFSPDTLNFIWFHLWPNAYKNEETALCNQMVRNGNTSLYFAPDSIRGYIDSLDFKINGEKARWDYDPEHIDICKIMLGTPLLPGDSVLITTPFRVKIPSAEFSRLGHDGKAFMITQWYPKPAVYDRKGWHPMPYLNQGEFYSEFGNFDVTIILPEDYVVGATGDLVYDSSDSTKTGLGLPSDNELWNSLLSDDKAEKTLRYRLDSIHDFAWFANKDFIKKSKVITLESGRKVKLTALFLYENAEAWKYALKQMEQGVKLYSRLVGEYPFDVCTAVDGALSAGAGMEYPTITVVSGGDALETTLVHEIGHNWFYGILAFNERDYPWMDEGINTFYQSLYEEKYFGSKSLIEIYSGRDIPALRGGGLNFLSQYYLSYLFPARFNLDQPATIPSDEFTKSNYGVIVYMKTPLMLRYLRDYLGVEEFNKLMQGFYEKWKFKHPQPEDFRTWFEENSPKDVSWFFNQVLPTKRKIDYAIAGVKTKGDSIVLKIRNKGDITGPFSISAIDKFGVVTQTKWYDGIEKKGKIKFPKTAFSSLKIDAGNQMPDINRKNNLFRSNGLFKKGGKPKLKFLYALPNDDVRRLYAAPALGWNKYSGFMLGGAFFNDPAFEHKWQYVFVPLYGFGSKQINGEAAVYRNFHTYGFIRKWSLGLTARKYDYAFSGDAATLGNPSDRLFFARWVPELKFYFKTPSNISTISHTLTIRDLEVYKQQISYGTCGVGNPEPVLEAYHFSLAAVDYNFFDRRKINPYGFKASFQANSDVVKMWVSAYYGLTVGKHKRIDARFFAGNIFSYNSNSPVDYAFKMSSWSGSDDYLYDYTYLGRSQSLGSGLWSAQMTPAEGGFSIYSPLGRSWSWITALNLKSSLPFTGLVRLYANLGLYPDALNDDKAKMLYEAGAYLNIVPRYFEIYFPFLWSKEFTDVLELNNRPFYEQKIRFVLRFDLMNPFKFLRDIQF